MVCVYWKDLSVVAASGEATEYIVILNVHFVPDLTFRKSIEHGYRASILVFWYRRVNKRSGCKVGSEQFSLKEFKYH